MAKAKEASKPEAASRPKAPSQVEVEMLVSRAGDDFAHEPGQIVKFPAADAKRLIEAGQAKAVSKSKRESAETL